MNLSLSYFQFQQGIPLKLIDLFQHWSNFDDKEKLQIEIYNEILIKSKLKVHDKEIIIPSKSYHFSFIKHLIRLLEKENEQVNELIYDYSSFLLNENEDYFYKRYSISNSTSILLKEDKFLISNGTTGLRTWQASLRMIEYLQENPDIIKNKSILEIGSGIGLLGITLSKFHIKNITLSDVHDSVLSLLEGNVELNQLNLDIKRLDWNNYKEKDLLNYDVMIGSDVAYDPSLATILASFIGQFLRLNSKSQVWLACTLRNEETFQIFQNSLGKQHIMFYHLI
ncbi:hypothetical protein K502DRAFT_351587 [Neoconidiobolus thromboides FSU 785]|nr:hypothetical protein K502DRAFT_351587 [Neoconidiobolus thromboides FSU 785]